MFFKSKISSIPKKTFIEKKTSKIAHDKWSPVEHNLDNVGNILYREAGWKQRRALFLKNKKGPSWKTKQKQDKYTMDPG